MTPASEKAAPIPADVMALADRIARQVATSGKTGRVHQIAYEPAKEAAALAIMQTLSDREARPSLPDSREAAEDERDRLYGEAEMQHAAALLRNDIIAGEFHANAASWLKEAGNGAMLPADRARARQGGNNG